MTDEEMGTEEGQETEENGADDRSTRDRVEDGIKQGLGVLGAFKDAIEETIQEAKERGDLSAERAKEVMKDALDKAQAAGEKAREHFDSAQGGEFKDALDGLKERVANLEESVFGSVQVEEEPEAPEEAEEEAAEEPTAEAEDAEEEAEAEA